MNLFITVFTRSPYYHVGIYDGDGFVIEMRVTGALRRDLRGSEGARHFIVIPAPQGKGRAALAWAKTQMKVQYDRSAIKTLVLNRIFVHLHLNYTPNDTYTCSEFVTVAFKHAGVDLFAGVDAAGTVPGDFARFVPPHARAQTFRRRKRRKAMY